MSKQPVIRIMPSDDEPFLPAPPGQRHKAASISARSIA